MKNFHWRITYCWFAEAALLFLPEKAAERSTGTFAKQGVNAVLSLGRNDGQEVLLPGLNSGDN